MKRIFIVLALLAVAFSAAAQENCFEKKTYTSEDGTVLNYRLLAPDENAAGKKFPLVIFLHGSGERGNDNKKQMRACSKMFMNPVNREKYPAYVLFPQCPEGEWWTYDRKPEDFDALPYADTLNTSLAMVKGLIDRYLEMPEVDRSRVYVFGISMGGVGTYDIVAHYPEIFAAAVPLCGAIAPGHLGNTKGVAFRIFHGDDDTSVPVECSRRAYRELKAAGIKVEYIEIQGGKHSIGFHVYNRPDFMEWLFKQKKSKKYLKQIWK